MKTPCALSPLPRPLYVLACAALTLTIPAGARDALATISYATFGFEEDVDVVVSPNRRFLLMPEESEDGASARLTIVQLEPTDGRPLGIVASGGVPGFEKAVDPIIVPEWPGEPEYTAIVPVESADGSESGVLVLRLNPGGAVIDFRAIDLGDLGFREDVDPVATNYMLPGIGFVALESEDGTQRGILAIDVDPNDEPPAGNAWGSCTLLSTDGRAACGGGIAVDWLPRLAEGVDPVAYEVAIAARLAVPVISDEGNDLLLLDFDPHFEPPVFAGWSSVAGANAGGEHPLSFPGYEQDVDLVFHRGACGAAPIHVIVPVEGADGTADLYGLDADGNAQWVLSDAAADAGLTILGYEVGVDLLPLCDPQQAVVPLEDEAGDADLWIVDLVTGEIIARAEDPAVNPGLTIPGYEIGVEPLQWDSDRVLVPYEGDEEAGLYVFDHAAVLESELAGDPIVGFLRSVDPTVAPLADPSRKLYVPVQGAEAGDADILIFPTPGDLGDWQSVEALNPTIELGRFEVDLDMGLVDHWLPGQAWIYLPEEDAGAGAGRLRCEQITAGARLLVAAMEKEGATPRRLFTVHGFTGTIIQRFEDVMGLEAGLDMANGTGHVEKGNQPSGAVTPGTDPDSDPTSVGEVGPAAVNDGDRAWMSTWDVEHANPFRPLSAIHFTLERGEPVRLDIFDLTGRLVRVLHDGRLAPGPQVVYWDGRDERGGDAPAGVYFVRIRGEHGEGATSKLLLLRD